MRTPGTATDQRGSEPHLPEGHMASGTCRGTLLGDQQACGGDGISLKDRCMAFEGEGLGNEVRECCVL